MINDEADEVIKKLLDSLKKCISKQFTVDER